MRMTLLVHIAAGSLAIVSGYVALFAAKGAKVHRRAGVVFVGSMVTMGLFGAGMAAFKAELVNVVAGVVASYLVVTGLTTVRPATPGSRRVDTGAMLVALATGLASLTLGGAALVLGEGTPAGPYAPLFLVFGTIACLCGVGDLRMMRAGGIQGPRRLARHLWRMCVGLFIAAGSFFLGQADEIPERLRIFPLLLFASFLPLLAMLYWLWRVRIRPRFRRRAAAAPTVVAPGTPEPLRTG
ncbi:MAG TPA: hypothetical protein VGB15_23910 [Longimicrobium sp.]